MVNRCAQKVAFTVAGLIALTSTPVYAAPPSVVPIFNGWTYADWFPQLLEQATESYNALGPIAWLVMGALLAGIVIEELFRVVWVARGGNRRDLDDDTD